MSYRSTVCAAAWMVVSFAPLTTSCVLFKDIDSIRPTEANCTPDVVVECVCANGEYGTQRCLASGRYEECICGDSGPEGDADGRTSTSDTDAGPTDGGGEEAGGQGDGRESDVRDSGGAAADAG